MDSSSIADLVASLLGDIFTTQSVRFVGTFTEDGTTYLEFALSRPTFEQRRTYALRHPTHVWGVTTCSCSLSIPLPAVP